MGNIRVNVFYAFTVCAMAYSQESINEKQKTSLEEKDRNQTNPRQIKNLCSFFTLLKGDQANRNWSIYFQANLSICSIHKDNLLHLFYINQATSSNTDHVARSKRTRNTDLDEVDCKLLNPATADWTRIDAVWRNEKENDLVCSDMTDTVDWLLNQIECLSSACESRRWLRETDLICFIK